MFFVPRLLQGSFDTEIYIASSIQLPIILTAILVGMSISAGSAALQVSLNNPLADPSIIGISSGASVMAAFYLLVLAPASKLSGILSVEYSSLWLPIFCFIGACISGGLIYFLATRLGRSMASFILAGIAISTLASGIVGWLYLLAQPQALQGLSFWLMGSLSQTSFKALSVALPVLLLALGNLLRLAKEINLLYLGETQASLSGVNTKRLQTEVFLTVAVLVGVSVSIAGSIAFLGLLVPHIVRKIHGYENHKVFSTSALLGAIILVMCAIINEYAFDYHVPLSMLTASFGAPFFIYVLLSKRQSSVYR